jgi:hypothetical protein
MDPRLPVLLNRPTGPSSYATHPCCSVEWHPTLSPVRNLARALGTNVATRLLVSCDSSNRSPVPRSAIAAWLSAAPACERALARGTAPPRVAAWMAAASLVSPVADSSCRHGPRLARSLPSALLTGAVFRSQICDPELVQCVLNVHCTNLFVFGKNYSNFN